MKRTLATLLLAAILPFPVWAAEPSFIDVDGGRLAYESCAPAGATKTIILVHDGLLHSAAWDGTWPIFCTQFRTVRFDLRGYGRSPPSTRPYSSVADIGAVMEALNIDHAILVGASANGGRAMAFALDHPNAVEALVVVGPSVPGVPPSDAFLQMAAPVIDCLKKNDLSGAVAAVARFDYLVAAKNTDAGAKALALLRANPQNLAPRTLEDPSGSIVDRLGELSLPTLVIVGADDHPNNRHHAQVARDKIVNAMFVTMQNAGHLPYLEHPEDFAALVSAFLKARTR